MNHTEYIGKILRDLVKDMPNYAINFYHTDYKNKHSFLKDVLHDEELLKKEIVYIKTLCDYDFIITLK